MADRRDPGFTLIELMVVLGIVAVLIAIALPSLLGSRRKANDVQVTSMLTAVGRAQAGWEPLQGGFTDDLALLEETVPELGFGDADDRAVHVSVGDVGQVLLYARSDSGTWFGLRYVAGGPDVGRHTCSGAASDMTLVACTGTDW